MPLALALQVWGGEVEAVAGKGAEEAEVAVLVEKEEVIEVGVEKELETEAVAEVEVGVGALVDQEEMIDITAVKQAEEALMIHHHVEADTALQVLKAEVVVLQASPLLKHQSLPKQQTFDGMTLLVSS